MSIEEHTHRESDHGSGVVSADHEPTEEDAAPRELESAFLSICLFGGLLVFAVGCVLIGW